MTSEACRKCSNKKKGMTPGTIALYKHTLHSIEWTHQVISSTRLSHSLECSLFLRKRWWMEKSNTKIKYKSFDSNWVLLYFSSFSHGYGWMSLMLMLINKYLSYLRISYSFPPFVRLLPLCTYLYMFIGLFKILIKASLQLQLIELCVIYLPLSLSLSLYRVVSLGQWTTNGRTMHSCLFDYVITWLFFYKPCFIDE